MLFRSPGNVDIVVTKQFRQPYIGVVGVVPGNTTNDAQVATINVPTTYTNILNADVIPQITIRNMGIADLTTAQIGYFIDSNTPITQAWTGNLTQYQTQQHTFSQITLPSGTHTFTAFISLPNGMVDEYHHGDTITKTFHVTAGDAAVVSHNAFPNTYCEPDTITPKITFTNKGTVNLLSADINYQIDSQTPVTFSWTGNIAPNEQATVSFSPITLLPGSHTFTSFTSNPNGGSDENPANDSKQSTFEVFANTEMIVVQIKTDYYGGETTWEIKNDTTGIIVYSGGPYPNYNPQTFNEERCLGIGCYTFTIKDSYGDGQSGYSSNGSYSVTNTTTSEVYGSGSGNWGSSQSINFCIGQTSEEEFAMNPIIIYPNPAIEFVELENLVGTSEIRISNVSGQVLIHQTSNDQSEHIDVSSLSSGIYTITIISGENRLNEKLIIIK